jgi:hypothetical protein
VIWQKKEIETIAPENRYMLVSVQNIRDDVHPENILAMIVAVDEFGKNPETKKRRAVSSSSFLKFQIAYSFS